MLKLEEILKKKNDRKRKLEAGLNLIVSQLITLGALKVILFGSLAEDEVDVYSDLDLLVVMPSTRSGKKWMKFIYESIERGCASDIIVYNQKELEEEKFRSAFLRNVLASGKVVYEKRV